MSQTFWRTEKSDPAFAPVQHEWPRWVPDVVGFPSTDDGMWIQTPWLSDTTERPATPDEHGFVKVQTGGGCTAWQRVEPDGAHLLITDGDTSAPDTPADGWILARYPDEESPHGGEPEWLLHVLADGTMSLTVHEVDGELFNAQVVETWDRVLEDIFAGSLSASVSSWDELHEAIDSNTYIFFLSDREVLAHVREIAGPSLNTDDLHPWWLSIGAEIGQRLSWGQPAKIAEAYAAKLAENCQTAIEDAYTPEGMAEAFDQDGHAAFMECMVAAGKATPKFDPAHDFIIARAWEIVDVWAHSLAHRDPVHVLRVALGDLADTVLSLAGTVIEDDENGGPILEQARQASALADAYLNWS